METIYSYLLKSSVSLILFYAFYRLVVFQNTYFKMRRFTLLAILFFSMLYPLVDIADWLLSKDPIHEILTPYVIVNGVTNTELAEVVVSPDSETSALTLSQIGLTVYIAGIALLLFRMIIQLISLLMTRRRAVPRKIGSHTVLSLSDNDTPFSFFFWVFINPDRYSAQEGNQILTHELTHARQYHSLDVLFSELFTIFFWFNPFVWLLKQEIRVNLEHLADEEVLDKGIEATTYQYSLLRLCHHVTSNKLVNNFNIPQFKRRIIMMNRDKSNKNSLLKYALLIPVAGLLIISGNAQAVISKVKSEVIELPALNQDGKMAVTGTVVDEKGISIPGASVIVKGSSYGTISDKEGNFSLNLNPGEEVAFSYVGRKSIEIAPSNSNSKGLKVVMPMQAVEGDEIVVVGYAADDKPVKRKGSDEVFTVVEEMPEYPGGVNALLEYLAKNIKYPVTAQEKKIQGRVIVGFVITKTGKVADIEIKRGVSPDLDAEAIRVIKGMQDWKPGKQRGVPVNVLYTLPVSFRLQGGGDSKPATPAKPKPVVVVDGATQAVGYDLNSIDPNRIETINVMKDEAAVKKYGDRGKNGAIEITTKK